MKPVFFVFLGALLSPSYGFFFGATYTDICDHLCRCPQSILEASTHALDCRDRNITSLKENLMFPEEILRIDFTRNNIEDLKRETFDNNLRLAGIDFSDNNLVTLPEWTFENIPNLRELAFKNNRLRNISMKAFAGLNNLTKLDLSYNQLEFLPREVFNNLYNLEYLNLNFNPLASISGISLATNVALRTLHLSSLGLQRIVPEFFHANLTQLSKISLSFNEFTVVPSKALSHVKDSLQDLDFSGNPIKSLGAYSFYGLNNIKNLRLDQMLKLETIDAYAFGDLKHLETCTLRYMPRISHLDPLAFHTSNKNETGKPIELEDFTFSFSILSTLPKDLLDWNKIRHVNLQYNKWYCDCSMKWIKNSTLIKLTGKKMVCSAPKRLRGHRIANVPAEDFTCSPEEVAKKQSLGVVIGLVIAGIGISLATIAILVYWRQGWLFVRPHGNYRNIQRSVNEITIVEDNIAMEQ